MIESLELYFNSFRNFEMLDSERKLSYFELMGISWSLHLIHAFYSIFSLYLGVKTYSYFSNSNDFTHFVLESLSFKFQKLTLMTTLFSVVLYPFLFQFAYKFWKGSFKFYFNIFQTENEIQIEHFESESEVILNSAFSSNLFLLIPIIGNVLSNISLAFLLFKGMKERLLFTSLQACLVLITPLFLLFLFSVFSASYFIFLFTIL